MLAQRVRSRVPTRRGNLAALANQSIHAAKGTHDGAIPHTYASNKGAAMKDKTVERKLVDLEQQYWLALKHKDVEAVIAMTDDPCIVVGASGVGVIDHPTYAATMKKANWEIEDFELGADVRVRMLGDEVAIVAYTVHEALTVDGQRIEFDAADASTWVRRDDRWLCALHSEAHIGDAFGRDRASSA